MREIFYEETAEVIEKSKNRKKYNLCTFFTYFSCFLIILLLFVYIFTLDLSLVFNGLVLLNVILAFLPIISLIATAIFLSRFRNRFNVDYDYIFVTGSITVSKVINNIKRYVVIKFECKQIEKLGKLGSKTFEKYANLPDLKPKILSQNVTAQDGKGFYYMVVNNKDGKHLLVFECSQTFISNVIRFCNSTILEKE